MLIVFQYIETLLLLFLVQLCNPVEIGVLVNNVRIIIRFFFWSGLIFTNNTWLTNLIIMAYD